MFWAFLASDLPVILCAGLEPSTVRTLATTSSWPYRIPFPLSWTWGVTGAAAVSNACAKALC
eukprot:1665803-Alexandrium_andersonii.AAC.1